MELKLALDTTSATRLERDRPPPRNVVFAIGPEGGFGASDLERLTRAGFERIGVGPRILRTETAAIAVCALAQACWGDF